MVNNMVIKLNIYEREEINMSKRGDCIHKRKDNRWEGRYIKQYVGGRAKYASVYGKTYSEAKQKLQAAKSQNTGMANEKEITDELFEVSLYNWLSDISPKVKPKTYQQYLFCTQKYIIPYIGSYKAKDINAYLINELLANLSKSGKTASVGGLSESTLNSTRYIILATLQHLIEQRKINDFNGKISFCRTYKKREAEIFTAQEFSRLEDILYINIDTWKFGIILCMYTGLRIGELCALQWKDVNISDRYISVSKNVQRITNQNIDNTNKTSLQICTPKTEYSTRTIPLAYNLCALLEKYIAHVDKEHYIITNSSKIPDPRTVENRYKKYLLYANIPQKNFHVLRHTFASRCIEAGMDVKSLSIILGHSNISITMNRYVHPSESYKLEQIDKVSSHYGQNNGHKFE